MEDLKVLKTLLSLIRKVSLKYYFLLFILSILTAGNVFLNIFIPKLIIDSLSLAGSSELLLKKILGLFLVKLLVLMGMKIFESILKKEAQILQNGIMLEFSKKTLNLEYAKLEDAKVLDLKERAIFAVNNYGALNHLMSIIQTIIVEVFVVLTVVTIIWNFSIPLLLVIIGLVVLYFLEYKKSLKKIFAETQKVIPINRKFGYYLNTSLEDKNQKDYRLYDMSDMMADKITELNMDTRDWLDRTYKIQGNSQSILAGISLLSKGIAYIYTTIRAMTDRLGSQIGIGDFVFYINSTEKLFTSFGSLSKSYGDMKNTIDVLKPFGEFMSLEENQMEFGSRELGDFQSLEFENVIFSYPNTDKLILNNISFKINRGDKISIVGLNNAGKSTIVKLICGFFRPDSGTIKVNGFDIKTYDYQMYMDMISPVFQDFKLFPFTLGENISNTEKIDSRVEESIKKVGLWDKIMKLPKKMDSKMEKSIYKDAIDMSGGEKQKLAIARAIYKKGQLVILDEPTSALDPMAEAEIYEDFSKLVEDRTAIYISHRMSSSLLSDKILLLNENVIEDFDSHSNLMKNNQLYRDLFLAQAKNFN